MTASEGIGGLFGSLITFGIGMWGVKKIGEALNSKETSLLNDTEYLD
jgi:hypothetical protein